MINCRDATRLMSRAMDESLPLWQRVLLRLHLAICEGCRNARRQMEFLRRAVQQLL